VWTEGVIVKAAEEDEGGTDTMGSHFWKIRRREAGETLRHPKQI